MDFLVTATTFLKSLRSKFREISYLAGPAEATPEGTTVFLGKDALAPRIFEQVANDAIEADRTFLGLLLFKGVLENATSLFPNLNSENFQRLQHYTLDTLENNDNYVELTYYALACNDLGKTQALVEENIRLRGRKAPDHDQLLLEVVLDNPILFPGLKSLPNLQQQQYKDGLNFNFNLGQMVQCENLPYNLFSTANVPRKSKALRLLAEVYDFAGVLGHVNWKSSIVMNDINCDLFLHAIDAILAQDNTADEEIARNVYTNYIRYRAKKCGLEHEPLFYLFGRIAGLSRATDFNSGKLIVNVWNKLSSHTQQILLTEMLLDGFQRKAILIYYFPAVIANAIKATGDFTAGLGIALEKVADVYQMTRKQLTDNGISNEPGVYTVNVSNLAKEMNSLERIITT